MPIRQTTIRGHQVILEARAIELAAKRGYRADQITSVHHDDNGDLASVGVGQTEDGMARFVLNFAL